MNTIKKITLVALLASSTLFAQENKQEGHDHSRPDSHAPIGVMGAHTHDKGEFMVSYRYMYMGMEGMLNGSDDIDNAGVLEAGFPVTPTEMNMQMHMLGIMYAPSDRVTLMAMANYTTKNMDLLVIPMDLGFNTEAAGFGDIKIAALINLLKSGNHNIHANVGLSIPTGSINERGDIPVQEDALLAYPMQIGSGTFDPSLGITYASHCGILGWGAQAMYTLPIDENDKEYTFGDKSEATVWASVKASNFISFSARAKYVETGEINGAAEELIALQNVMPLFNTANSGREQLDVSLGSNVVLDVITKGLRFGIEAGLPVYQNVNGIQMKNLFAGTAGIQYAF